MKNNLIFNWKEAVLYISKDKSLLGYKDIANLVTYARQLGIGKPATFQTTSYSSRDIYKLRKLILWWKMLNEKFSPEWRDKKTTTLIQKIAVKSVAQNSKIDIYAIFCPSYKKGAGAYGYTGKTGIYTQNTIKKLLDFMVSSNKLGIEVDVNVFFSDLLLENFKKLKGTSYKEDLTKNYNDFKERFKAVRVRKLSSIKELKESIGEEGIVTGNLNVPENVYQRVLARNKIFYTKILGWNERQVEERTSNLARCYAMMGKVFRKQYPEGIMYWVESAYERGTMYSGMEQDNPIPIIYPKKDDE